MCPSPKTGGIYIHFPFCVYKCGFCDFYSGAFSYNHNYFELVVEELELYQNQGLLEKYYFDTLYFGGGTPSLASEKDLAQFFKKLDLFYPIKDFKEITIEMNPEDVTQERLNFYQDLGINRISLGVQSLSANILKILGRRASLEKNIDASLLVAQFFKNYSLDFMYGVPTQDLCTELFSYSTFSPPHISTYELTLYPKTPFYLNQAFFTQPEEKMVENYQEIHHFFTQLGYEHYEVSNFAKPSYQSLHNQHYWNQDDYLGLGAGASGYIHHIRYTNWYLQGYTKNVKEGVLPVYEQEKVDSRSFFIDLLILKLRKTEKIFIKSYLQEFSMEISERLQNFFVDMSRKGYILYDELEKSIVPDLKTWLFSDLFTRSVYNILY